MRAVAALLAASALAVAAAPATATGPRMPLPDAAAPHGCAAIARVAAGQERGVDLWLRCGFHVRDLSVRGLNRSFRVVSPSPVLEPGGPMDSISCELRRATRIQCWGDVTANARIHVRLGVTRRVCRAPRMRLGIGVFGGPECSGYCPAIGYRADLETSADRRRLGCAGR